MEPTNQIIANAYLRKKRKDLQEEITELTDKTRRLQIELEIINNISAVVE